MSVEDYQKILHRRFGKRPKPRNSHSYYTYEAHLPDQRSLINKPELATLHEIKEVNIEKSP